MTEVEALRTIQGLAGANRIRLTRHAALRARQRGAHLLDVRAALMSCTSCLAEGDALWKTLGGADTAGDSLSCIVAIEGLVLVVTLY